MAASSLCRKDFDSPPAEDDHSPSSSLLCPRTKKMNQLPAAGHVEPDSKGLLRFIRRGTDSAGTGSSKDGSESRCSIPTRRSSPATLRSSPPETKESLEDELDDDFDDDVRNTDFVFDVVVVVVIVWLLLLAVTG